MNAPATPTPPLRWLTTESAFFDWVVLERPIEARAHAQQQVEQCRRLGLTVHHFLVQVGGQTIYPSRTAPQSDRIDGDLLGALVEENHRVGHRLIADWYATLPACALQAREHPDWQRRSADGTPQGVTVCYNSPYREFLFAQIEEV